METVKINNSEFIKLDLIDNLNVKNKLRAYSKHLSAFSIVYIVSLIIISLSIIFLVLNLLEKDWEGSLYCLGTAVATWIPIIIYKFYIKMKFADDMPELMCIYYDNVLKTSFPEVYNQKLQPGMFRFEPKVWANSCKRFGLREGQTRENALLKDAKWYNLEGEMIGYGDLSSADMRRIQEGLRDNELFIIHRASQPFSANSFIDNDAAYVINNNGIFWKDCNNPKLENFATIKQNGIKISIQKPTS